MEMEPLETYMSKGNSSFLPLPLYAALIGFFTGMHVVFRYTTVILVGLVAVVIVTTKALARTVVVTITLATSFIFLTLVMATGINPLWPSDCRCLLFLLLLLAA